MLAPLRGVVPSEAPTVRIFLGSEPAQRRAERIFVWSIEQVRDPARRYEIFVMKDLDGFEDRRWTTGFTNYRFAIPHFAGGGGRAIYNDVDQIYRSDPARLFDTDLGQHGYRSIAPDDTSVMLLECERMAAVWPFASARTRSKRRLHADARSVRGLWGPLDPAWNVRDDEREADRAHVLHFTTLHTQPWRPFPERYAYQPNPVGAIWHGLEADADAAGMRVRTREDPSDRYAGWRRGWAGRAAADAAPDAFTPPPPGAPRRTPVPELRAEGWLADAPDDDVPWLLDELCTGARERVVVTLFGVATWRALREWETRLEAAASAHPDLAFELRTPRGTRRGGAWPGPAMPRVWVLCDERPGNATQARGVAEALDWPCEVKHLRYRAASRVHNRWLGASVFGIDRNASSPLEPPWPDLVIAAGRRTAPVAQWIRERAGGAARIVMLGRKGGDDAELFDLSVTPSYTRLFPHPHRIETAAPLHRVSRDALAKASEEWADRLGTAASPRIAVLVGGTSGQYRLDAESARRLGATCADLAAGCGGSLLATTSRRLGAAATEAFADAIGDIAYLHRWKPDDPENPYLGLLAHADAFVITGDSESMLAEATSLGKPVAIHPLPVRPSFRALSTVREWVWRRATAKPAGPRGTPRPQRGLERACGKAIERGFVRPSRDLDRLHAELVLAGLAEPFDGFDPRRSAERPRAESGDRRRVVDAVRAMMGVR